MTSTSAPARRLAHVQGRLEMTVYIGRMDSNAQRRWASNKLADYTARRARNETQMQLAFS